MTTTTATKTIILAKDIEPDLSKERSFLSRTDVSTFFAASNEQILELHRAKKADLIVAMIDSPDMSGEELCSLIRGDRDLSKVSIIIVCLDSVSHHQRCLKCQANSFIAMPVNNAVLLEEMHQLLHISPRKSCRIPVGISVEGTSGKMPFTAHMDNLSSSGMLFETAAKLSEGDTIICTFALPDSYIRVTADIVRMLEKERKKNTHHYGVRFVELRADSLAAIEAFIGKNRG